MSKYVIIGNSTAAVGAVEAIRKTDKANEIVIISDETYHTYSRPLISYMLLGKTTRDKMKYRADSFYEDNNCSLILNKKAVKINPQSKTVVLDDGKELSYEKLLVATGSCPFVPPIMGLDTVKNKFTFMSLKDALALEEVLNDKAKVLIIGAGLIGLKCAEGIKNRVGEINIVDLAPKVLSSILDDEAAAHIKKHLEANGLNFYLADSVKELKENTAELTSGKNIDFDILVLAVGVRPNTGLVKDAGGNVARGIVINAKCETSMSDIYAAGDCVESLDASTGISKIMAILPNAYMQGECAGMNMSGQATCFEKAIPMNAIGFFGEHILSAGAYIGEAYTEYDGADYKKLFYSDNKLNGYILIGNVEKAGIYTSLIREKTPLDKIDFSLICEKPGLMAFSKQVRQQKLGGQPV